MTDDLSRDDLPLIDGLEGLPGGSFRSLQPPDGLREAVLAETLRVVHGRSLRRRLGMLVGAVVLYALGLATNIARSPAPTVPPLEGPAPAADNPAALLGEVAMAAPADRARLLKRAGDAYLARDGDLERALDCYRQLLEISPAIELASSAVGEGDTWLWTSLKQGQQLHDRR